MEGPTPVSALIHAATMVAAGVYLVGRIFPILTPDARLFIAIIGVTTLTMAALIAIAQSDIKKVLAFSTLSQLGYMMLAMGIGSWIGGLFHLITHAFFKALLFLGSGSVIHAMHHEQELPQYGGLWRKIPVTAFTFAIAVLAIAGVPLLSGYYSKDMILMHAGAFASLGQGISKYYWLFFILPTTIAYVTAFYMTRCWMLTFWGKPRNQHAYEHAREAPVMYMPLIVLALFAVVAGYPGLTNIRELIESSIKKENAPRLALGESAKDKVSPFSQAWPSEVPANEPEEGLAPRSPASQAAAAIEPHDAKATPADEESRPVIEAMEAGEKKVKQFVTWAPLVGILAGFLMYMRGYAVANVLMKFAPLRLIHRWLYRRMYFDELYMGVFVLFTMALSRVCRAIDEYIIDGIVNAAGRSVKLLSFAAGQNDQYVVDGAVHGVAGAAAAVGMAARAPQTGRIRLYVMALFGMVVLCIAAVALVGLWSM
jgi:NADH-quinone oxidoreductase subunit L